LLGEIYQRDSVNKHAVPGWISRKQQPSTHSACTQACTKTTNGWSCIPVAVIVTNVFLAVLRH